MKADVDDYLKVPYFDTDYLNNLKHMYFLFCVLFSMGMILVPLLWS